MLSSARKGNNRVERHWLQKLVENGEQLDLADEAKLNKLVATHQKKKDRDREYYQNNRVECHRL
jgi:hypothetical protein